MDYTQEVREAMEKYQEALYYLSLLENLPEKEVLNRLHALSLFGDKEILEAFFEQGKSIVENPKLPSIIPDINWKKIGLSLLGWAADQKHVLSSLYILKQLLEDTEIKFQHQDDYYKLIQQAEKIKGKLQKIHPLTPKEKQEYDQLMEEVDLVIDDRKNFFKDEEKRHR